MRQFLLFSVVLIFLSVSVFGIGFSAPVQKDYFFVPDSKLVLNFGVGNTADRFSEFSVSVDAGALQDYVVESDFLVGVLAYSQRNFVVEIDFPSELAPGIYPIFVKVHDSYDSSVTSGFTGAVQVINVINPMKEGFISASLDVDDVFSVLDPVSFSIDLRNIGMSSVDFNGSAVLEQNGVIKRIVNFEKLSVDSFDNVRLKYSFDSVGLEPGVYLLKVFLDDGRFLSKEVVFGEPYFVVKDVSEIKASGFNDISMSVFVHNWSSAIDDVSFSFEVVGLVHSSVNVSLVPGFNNVSLRAHAGSGKSGEYPGYVKITGKGLYVKSGFFVDVEGSRMISGSSFRNVEELVEDEDYELEVRKFNYSENKTIGLEAVDVSGDYDVFYVLAFCFAVFVFILGLYFGKKRFIPGKIN